MVAIVWGKHSLNIESASFAPTFPRRVAPPKLRRPTIGTQRHGSIASMLLAYVLIAVSHAWLGTTLSGMSPWIL